MNKNQYSIEVENSIWGFALADALGVPFEFHLPEEIEDIDISFELNNCFERSHNNVPLGTWSDDTSQFLILLESLIENEGLILQDLSKKLLLWKNKGYMSIDGYTFDIGIQTYEALNRIENKKIINWFKNIDEYENGNGSLMRVLALPLYSKAPNFKLIIDAHYQSFITHPHMRSQVCCAIYSMWARYLLNGIDIKESWFKSIETIVDFYQQYRQDDALEELEIILSFDSSECHGSGYVVDTLHTVRKCMFNNYSYIDVVTAAIKTGNDTDTTAALSGGLAAITFGLDSVPNNFWEQLRGKALINKVIDKIKNLN